MVAQNSSKFISFKSAQSILKERKPCLIFLHFSLSCLGVAGADPARVHWVHVHPPHLSKYMFLLNFIVSALNARSTLNGETAESMVHSEYYIAELKVHSEFLTSETRVHPKCYKLQNVGCTPNFKLHKSGCPMNLNLRKSDCAPNIVQNIGCTIILILQNVGCPEKPWCILHLNLSVSDCTQNVKLQNVGCTLIHIHVLQKPGCTLKVKLQNIWCTLNVKLPRMHPEF